MDSARLPPQDADAFNKKLQQQEERAAGRERTLREEASVAAQQAAQTIEDLTAQLLGLADFQRRKVRGRCAACLLIAC